MMKSVIVLLAVLAGFARCQNCPSQTDFTSNKITNGDFEDPAISEALQGLSMPGWVENTFEVGFGPTYNPRWGSFNQVASMAATSNNNYSQILNIEATTYILRFQYARSPGSSDSTFGLKVHWNNQVVFEVSGADIGSNDVYNYSGVLTAVSGTNVLKFEATGTDDETGMSIDNVEMYTIDLGGWEESGGACQCQAGYFHDGVSWSCTLCEDASTNCLECTYNTGSPTFEIEQFTCTSCAEGFYPSGSSCPACSTAITECLNCSGDGSICYNCNETADYFLDSQTCVACTLQACLDCSSLTVCIACDEGNDYFLDGDVCEQCSLVGCLDCSDLATCVACDEASSYVLEGSQCQYCDPSNNEFINATHQCEACSRPQCLTCSSLTQCSACNQTNQYFLNASNLC